MSRSQGIHNLDRPGKGFSRLTIFLAIFFTVWYIAIIAYLSSNRQIIGLTPGTAMDAYFWPVVAVVTVVTLLIVGTLLYLRPNWMWLAAGFVATMVGIILALWLQKSGKGFVPVLADYGTNTIQWWVILVGGYLTAVVLIVLAATAAHRTHFRDENDPIEKLRRRTELEAEEEAARRFVTIGNTGVVNVLMLLIYGLSGFFTGWGLWQLLDPNMVPIIKWGAPIAWGVVTTFWLAWTSSRLVNLCRIYGMDAFEGWQRKLLFGIHFGQTIGLSTWLSITAVSGDVAEKAHLRNTVSELQTVMQVAEDRDARMGSLVLLFESIRGRFEVIKEDQRAGTGGVASGDGAGAAYFFVVDTLANLEQALKALRDTDTTRTDSLRAGILVELEALRTEIDTPIGDESFEKRIGGYYKSLRKARSRVARYVLTDRIPVIQTILRDLAVLDVREDLISPQADVAKLQREEIAAIRKKTSSVITEVNDYLDSNTGRDQLVVPDVDKIGRPFAVLRYVLDLGSGVWFGAMMQILLDIITVFFAAWYFAYGRKERMDESTIGLPHRPVESTA